MSLPAFGVRRPVPANILMIVFLLGGLWAGLTLTREFFPDSTPKSCIVTLPYPGATPEEIEESLVRKVEDALADLDEVEMLTTSISEGVASIVVEFRDGIRDVKSATDEVERAIDALRDLPDEAERIQVTQFKPVLPVIMLTVHGEAEEEAKKRIIRVIRDELRSLPGMGDTVLSGIRNYEVRVDVDADALLEHGLSLPFVADAISAWLADIPGGTVRTESGNIVLRAVGADRTADEIREIVILSDASGRAVRVEDLAQVREYFADDRFRTRMRRPGGEGGPAANITVYKVGDQDSVRIAEMVRAYARGRAFAAGDTSKVFEPRWQDRVRSLLDPDGPGSERLRAYELGLQSTIPLPPGTGIGTSSDLARFIEGRIDLLVRNALAGAVLVFLTLLLFLNWRTAFWVGVGLLTALAGTLVFMTAAGVTLNLLTMFGLIIVIGLLVDDAIVVAENIQARHESGEPAMSAAITGAEQVAWPVVTTVISTIVAFLPLLFIRGQVGDLLGALPYVVAFALTMSLIECLLILPSHIGHSLQARDRRRPGPVGRLIIGFERARDAVLHHRIIPAYAYVLTIALRFRYVFLSLSVALLLVSLGLVAGGRVQFEFLPASDSETIIVEVRMPIGTPLEATQQVVQRFEDVASMREETLVINALVGVLASVDDTSGVTAAGQGTHLGQLFIELVPVEERDIESSRVIDAIRQAVGPVDEAESITFAEIQGGPAGRDITIQVTGEDDEMMLAVVAKVRTLLSRIDGVFDIADDDARGQREVRVLPRPEAAALGLSVREIARQLRAALFGFDAHVFSDRQEDIDVRVRLSEETRERLTHMEDLWVVTPDGQPVPMSEIAVLRETMSWNTIRRVDRRRAVTVTADTAPDLSPEEVMRVLTPDLERLAAENPLVGIETAGRQRQMRKAFGSLPLGFAVALCLIYVCLAWLFSSYVQPLAVMIAIPFGILGVVTGHLILGYSMTFLSLIGFVALSGIVVNDSLILVRFFNTQREGGAEIRDALVAAGRARFRPIMLTTVTTVLGLTPLMLEQSFQAKFLIPMAISISFGLMSATVLILIALPGILLVFDDIRRATSWLWYGPSREGEIPRPGADTAEQ